MTTPRTSKFAALLFALTIGVGAFLLFQVQFILAKQILPWFGGVPAVWTTCMLFFQVLLLAGYGYAHLLGSSRSPSRQRTIHLAALAVALALLVARVAAWPAPIAPSDAWKPGSGDDPVAAILGLLLYAIGLPFLVLAATGPLLQNWFGRCFPGRSPYRLYALSNLGSLLGLLSYPFLLEPALPLAGQSWVWSAGFLLFALGCGACAVLVGRTAPLPAEPSRAVVSAAATSVSAGRRAEWFVLAMIASVMLLATTSQISLEIGVVPFLWMMPLSLYLLSFILCFEYERSYRRGLWVNLLLAGASGTVLNIALGVGMPILLQLGIYLVTMFAACMVCHGEVVRRKPDPRHLTGFYLLVAAGGAAGGIFTGILAPALFADLWELPLGLVAATVVAVAITVRAQLPTGPAPAGARGRTTTGIARATFLAFPVLLSGLFVYHAYLIFKGYVHVDRNFFGVVRVSELAVSGKLRKQLTHGRILHGFQFADPELARKPTSYFGPGTAPDLANRFHPRRLAGQPLRFGIVGLGVGTLATYAVPGDSMRFYEIDPAVVDMAAGPAAIFTYLRDCLGSVDVALGDGRIVLEREPPQKFDVLVLDAFSSDAVPVHLLTLEAAELYLRHLSQDGFLLFNISNRFLDLAPVVRGLAKALGLTAVRIDTDRSGDTFYSTSWMLLARNGSLLAAPEIQRAAARSIARSGADLLWTDTYSNFLQVISL